jgi:hypothetical protein
MTSVMLARIVGGKPMRNEVSTLATSDGEGLTRLKHRASLHGSGDATTQPHLDDDREPQRDHGHDEEKTSHRPRVPTLRAA